MEAAEPASAGVNFPEPEDKDFDEDIGEEERKHYVVKYKDLSTVRSKRLHCTACDRHLGCAAKGDGRMRTHPMLRTLVCRACHTFYNSGEFERGDDGSELYCRWCGQGGQVYCCSACPHVFCAKCIKRNLGPSMIREIESLDDWKCFKCVPKGLWDLRATCWALLRYCDLKNRQAYLTKEPELKEKYQKECAVDDSECCRNKKRTSTPSRKREDKREVKAEKKEIDDKKSLPLTVKIPSGIQVKKFATVSVDSILKAGLEKKGVKRPGSPIMRAKQMPVRAPIPISPYPRPIAPMVHVPMQSTPRMPQPKRVKVQHTPIIMNANMPEPRRYRAPRPRGLAIQYPPMSFAPPLNSTPFNGLGNYFNTDNINLSLESLTQGLDMASVSAMAQSTSAAPSQDELVCTPDFPLEPLCEVTEEAVDDDVECITPGPVAPPKPPLLPQRSLRTLPDLSPENIVQMTENDVTVNAQTGGLKFRVDPQTLSSNKMYRLPDGRIFAINSNPNMPGGYSATIVAVSESGSSGSPSAAPLRGATYAANLSAVVASPTLPPLTKLPRKTVNVDRTPASQSNKNSKKNSDRNLDMKTPVEWYRYNLIDAVDALEYSLSRLNRLKKEAETRHLRTRTVDEMRSLHRTLERHLHTSATRFCEVRDNLNRGFKTYLRKKGTVISDDDDDVEILPDDSPPKAGGAGDDPIFIDENSLESAADSGDNRDGSEINDTARLGSISPSAGPDPLAQTVDESNKIDSNDNGTEKRSLNEEENSDLNDNLATKTISDIDTKDKSTNSIEEVQSAELQEKDDNDITENASGNPDKNDENRESSEKIDENPESNENEGKTPESTEKKHENPKTIEIQGENLESTENKDENPKSIEDENLLSPDNENSQNENPENVNSQNENLEKENSINDIEMKDTCVEEKNSKSKNIDDADSGNNESDGNALNATGFQENDSERDIIIPDALTDVDLLEGNAKDKNDKINGSSCENTMEMALANGQAVELSKNTDNDLQMSDEMIDHLLADDGTTDEISADLQKLTRSLESLEDNDLVNSEFN